MLTSETKRRLQSCRDLLVGKLPQPAQQVELITLALIYKFMDDLDEESVSLGGKRSFFTGPLAPYRWRALLPQTVSADQRVTLFSGGLEAIGNATTGAHLPALFRDIFRNAFLKFRDGRILTLFLNEINGFAYTHSEELGNAFEFLLQSSGAQGENGQFRTPRHIIDFIVACLDPKPTDKILDPACGTGGFLVSSYKHILQKHTSPGSTVPGDRLGRDQLNRVYHNLTGYDTDDHMVQLSKVNLFLHGFPDPAIHIYDTLSNDARWTEKADLILANPPFMTPKGGVTPHTRFRIPAKKAEVLFTDYIAEHLTPDGRAGIIVPNGIVATTQNAYVKLRRFLVEDSLVAVVSLPSGVFKPYSGVKTSILFLDKKLARQTHEILFLKISADGFDLGDQRRPIEQDDLPLSKRYLDRWFQGQLGETPPAEIPFKRVAKRELLASRAVSLQAEQFLGETVAKTSEHEIVRLGDVCETSSGGTPLRSKTEFYEGGTIPWVKSGEVAQGKVTATEEKITELGLKQSSAKLFPINTVLVAMYGATAGEVGILKIPATTNQAVCGVFPNDRFIPEFLFYALRSLKEEMKQRAGGGAQPNISQQIIRDLEIPLPPLEEQRRIVTEIEGYQQVIDGARQILAAYEIAITPEPEWEIVAFEDLCERMQYGLSTPLVEGGPGVKTFRMAEIIGGRAFDDGSMKSANLDAKETAKYRLEKGDILFNRTNSFEHVGRTGIFTLEGEYAFASYLIRLTIKRDLANPEFVNAWMNTRAFQAGVKSLASRAVGQSNISASSLAGYQIPLPPLPEQERIVAELDAEAARMEAVRGLIPAFEAKIARTLARVWGTPV
jgi:type I restriction enzyme M protein